MLLAHNSNIQKPVVTLTCRTPQPDNPPSPGVSSGTKPDQTALHPAQPAPRRQARGPRLHGCGAGPARQLPLPTHPTGRQAGTLLSTQAQRRMIPKTKQIKPPRKTRESTGSTRPPVPSLPVSHYSPLDPPAAAPARPAAAPGRRSSRRERGGRPVAPVPVAGE